MAQYPGFLPPSPFSEAAYYHFNLGNTWFSAGKLESAITAYRSAIRLKPDFYQAHFNLGNVLKQRGRLDDAVTAYRTAISVKQDFAEAYYNLGNTLKQQGQLVTAITTYRQALQIRPNFAQAHYNLGNGLRSLGYINKAMRAYGQAVESEPDFSQAQFALGMALLLTGDYPSGWSKFEYRPRPAHAQTKTVAAYLSRWNGNLPPQGKLILTSEQGLGDTIQFARFALSCRKLGIQVALQVDQRLVGLLSLLDPSIPVFSYGTRGPFALTAQYYPLLSLPHYLSIDLDIIPNCSGYLKIPQAKVFQWSVAMGKPQKLRIGIAWQGNPRHEKNHLQGRSFPLEAFSRLAKFEQVEWVSLQKFHGSEQLDACSFREKFIGIQPTITQTLDFVEMAAVMQNCHLIITSDTVTAHLAGALGLPTWVVVPYVPEWRWLLDRADSPWYATVKVFRQLKPNDWESAFQQVERALSDCVELSDFMTSFKLSSL